MQTIEASFEIITPMFIGGGNDDVELRPPSIKGALRFWWRALQWGKFVNQYPNDEVAALKALHTEEAKLFGNSAEGGGQGAFLLKVKTENIRTLKRNDLDAHADYKLTANPWHTYLLGLGLMKYENRANHYLRSAIVSGSFTVTLICKSSAHLSDLQDLLLLWGLLGGLGSRQRKGFGSISMTELKVGNQSIELPKNQAEVIDKLRKLISKTTNEPPFTAFSQSSKILCSAASNQTAWEQLGKIAKEMQMFRGWGFSQNGGIHQINRQPANHTAYTHKITDHKIVYDYLDNKIKTKQLPKSLSFGLPRSYGLSTTPRNDFKLEPTGDKRSRRASPVFIHVHQFADGQTMIIQSFLPATFLPTTDNIKIEKKISNRWNLEGSVSASSVNWDVINEYLALFNTWQTV